MKKYFYLLTAGLLIFCTGRAQIKKGQVLLGGGLSFTDLDSKPVVLNHSSNTFFNVSPSFGKAVKDNLVVGAGLTYGNYKWKENDGNNPVYTLKEDVYSLYFFARHYWDLKHGFSIFLEEDLRGTYSDQNGIYAGVDAKYVDEKSYQIGASLYGGLAYRMTRRCLLETGFQNLAYAHFAHSRNNGVSTGGEEIKYNTYTIGTNLSNAFGSFIIGCRYILD
jgi:hypothetical protein